MVNLTATLGFIALITMFYLILTEEIHKSFIQTSTLCGHVSMHCFIQK